MSAARIQSRPKTRRIEQSHWEKTIKELEKASRGSQHYFKAVSVEAGGSIRARQVSHISAHSRVLKYFCT